MNYKVTLVKAAQIEFEKLPKKIQLRVAGVFVLLAVNPFPSDLKKLSGRDGYRVRTNQYRILYNGEKEILQILVIRIS